MISIAAALIAGISGLRGFSWRAPVLIALLCAIAVLIDALAANELGLQNVRVIAIVAVSVFALWGAARAARSFWRLQR